MTPPLHLSPHLEQGRLVGVGEGEVRGDGRLVQRDVRFSQQLPHHTSQGLSCEKHFKISSLVFNVNFRV